MTTRDETGAPCGRGMRTTPFGQYVADGPPTCLSGAPSAGKGSAAGGGRLHAAFLAGRWPCRHGSRAPLGSHHPADRQRLRASCRRVAAVRASAWAAPSARTKHAPTQSVAQRPAPALPLAVPPPPADKGVDCVVSAQGSLVRDTTYLVNGQQLGARDIVTVSARRAGETI